MDEGVRGLERSEGGQMLEGVGGGEAPTTTYRLGERSRVVVVLCIVFAARAVRTSAGLGSRRSSKGESGRAGFGTVASPHVPYDVDLPETMHLTFTVRDRVRRPDTR